MRFVLKKSTMEDFLAVVDCCQNIRFISLDQTFMDPSCMQKGPPVYATTEKGSVISTLLRQRLKTTLIALAHSARDLHPRPQA